MSAPSTDVLVAVRPYLLGSALAGVLLEAEGIYVTLSSNLHGVHPERHYAAAVISNGTAVAVSVDTVVHTVQDASSHANVSTNGEQRRIAGARPAELLAILESTTAPIV